MTRTEQRTMEALISALAREHEGAHGMQDHEPCEICQAIRQGVALTGKRPPECLRAQPGPIYPDTQEET